MESQETEHIVFADRIDKARTLAYSVMKSMTDTPVDFKKDDVFIVWFSKTLHHWKSFVSAAYPNAPYIEVTYNGMKEETYLDVYKKIENVRIPD